MLNIRFDGKLDYLIDNIGFVNVSRNAGFTVPYKTGKQKYSLIFVESGEMNYYFTKNKKNDRQRRIYCTQNPQNINSSETFFKLKFNQYFCKISSIFLSSL